MSQPKKILGSRADFYRAVEAAYKKQGPAFLRAPIIAAFVAAGLGRATAYKWMKADSDICARDFPEITVPAMQAASDADTEAARAFEIPPMPSLVVLQHRVRKEGLLPVVELLHGCIGVFQQAVEFGRAKDGSMRNPALMMKASEHLRRAIETAAKLNETVAAQQEMTRLHEIIMGEIARVAPETERSIIQAIQGALDSAVVI